MENDIWKMKGVLWLLVPCHRISPHINNLSTHGRIIREPDSRRSLGCSCLATKSNIHERPPASHHRSARGQSEGEADAPRLHLRIINDQCGASRVLFSLGVCELPTGWIERDTEGDRILDSARIDPHDRVPDLRPRQRRGDYGD